MKKKRAFTLVELLVYLFLFSVLALTVFRSARSLHDDFICSEDPNERIVRLLLPIDIFERDVMTARCQQESWDEENMVFVKEGQDRQGGLQATCVGWQVSDNKLWRLEGDYDFIHSRWNKKVVRMVYEGIFSCCWHLDKDHKTRTVQAVRVTYTLSESESNNKERKLVSLLVRLRNGYR